jgi:cell division protein FtsI (penicillin-binding protein 3)
MRWPTHPLGAAVKGRLKAGAPSGVRAGAIRRGVTYSTSPLLASKTPPWRSKFVVALVGLGSCLLIGRAASIQIVHNRFYLDQGEKRYAHQQELQASRGRITDRNGELLATSVPVPSVWAIPKDVQATPAQKRDLARLLGMPLADLEKKIADRKSSFAWLKRQVDEPVWQQIAKLGIAGIHESREYRRKYPEGEAAAHVVGFTDVDDRGQEGVELSFQDVLQGKDGSRVVVKDRLGRVVEDIGDKVAPADGRDLELTIDRRVQSFAYQHIRDAVLEHKAKGGSVVVLDAQTGEVLALANYPSFNPADRRNVNTEQLRNRALIDTFEPGSTMKPFIAGISIDSNRLKPDSVIDTSSFSVSGFPIVDTHRYPQLSVTQIVQKSSNIGAAKMAMQLPAQEMWQLYSALGFGTKPELPFPGVAGGKLRPHKAWKPVDQSRLAYGYGLSASLLQMARSYTVFSHDGAIIPVTMQKPSKPPEGVRVFEPGTARTLRGMLQLAAGAEGTAPLAQTMGYSVGGKSGTAHKLDGDTYARDKYRAWFVGLSPIDKPRVIVAVMVDEPSNGKHYGGAVAAPVFSKVVAQTLRAQGVSPNLDVKPQIVAGPPAQENF